jgi:hypothetical protein
VTKFYDAFYSQRYSAGLRGIEFMKGRPSHRKGKVIGPQSEEHVQKRMKSRAHNKRKRVEV